MSNVIPFYVMLGAAALAPFFLVKALNGPNYAKELFVVLAGLANAVAFAALAGYVTISLAH